LTLSYPITGLDRVMEDPQTVVFHSGTRKIDGEYYTNGGRVLGVTAVADDLDSAVKKAYESVSKIHFQDMHYRRDIGRK